MCWRLRGECDSVMSSAAGSSVIGQENPVSRPRPRLPGFPSPCPRGASHGRGALGHCVDGRASTGTWCLEILPRTVPGMGAPSPGAGRVVAFCYGTQQRLWGLSAGSSPTQPGCKGCVPHPLPSLPAPWHLHAHGLGHSAIWTLGLTHSVQEADVPLGPHRLAVVATEPHGSRWPSRECWAN